MAIDRLFLSHNPHSYRSNDGWFFGEAVLHNCGQVVARLPFNTDIRGVVLGPRLIYTKIMRVSYALQGNGLGDRLMNLALPEIIKLADEYGFTERRLYAVTEPDNKAAIRILLKNGFKLSSENERSVSYQRDFCD